MTHINKKKSLEIYKDQDLSFIASVLIGDGCLSESGRLVIAHGNEQKDYCEWKAERLSSIFNQQIQALPTRQCTQIQVQRKQFKNLRYKWYMDNKKNILNILSNITNNYLEAITIWICDDGNVSPSINSKTKKVYSSSIQIFTFTELEESIAIADWFEKHINIRPYIHFKDRSKSNRKSAYILKFTASDTRALFKLIKEYIPNLPSMNYKFRYLSLDNRI